MAKFSKGQLVELIESDKGNIGYRFIITTWKKEGYWSKDGSTHNKGVVYKTDMRSTRKGRFLYAPESFLKLVNPDGDEQSEFTFDELINELKQGVTV